MFLAIHAVPASVSASSETVRKRPRRPMVQWSSGSFSSPTRWFSRGEHGPILIFDDATSERKEVDFRGTAEDVLRRLAVATSQGPPDVAPAEPEAPRGPGRRKLGVVAREVTLLPRHWEWLNDQPGGASVALRKLVEEAITHASRGYPVNEGRDRARRSQEAAYRFMYAMAGSLPGFDEAARALFARNQERFEDLIRGWPEDVRTHLLRLFQESLQ